MLFEDEPSVDGELLVDEVLSEDSKSAIEEPPVEDPCPSDGGGPGGIPGGGPPAPWVPPCPAAKVFENSFWSSVA